MKSAVGNGASRPGTGTPDPRVISILGATGSVGTSTVEVIAANPGQFAVEAVTAGSNAEGLAQLARSCGARYAAIADEAAYGDLKRALGGSGIEAAAGEAAVIEAARRPSDMVMAAIVGAAGLAPTMAAIERGAQVAFANKEVLVCAGPLVMARLGETGAVLLPVDSEHNAIFQVYSGRRDDIHRLILTASGGPFRSATREQMAAATPETALKHPVWSMGAKISIDSATMMNKGLEVIEAAYLFDMPEPQVDVLVHPQSIVHSLVEYKDGSILAQLGSPDMRTPIAHALAWPERISSGAERLDLAAMSSLSFEAPDEVRFPALRLARQSLKAGGGAPTVLNAANEMAVAAFLERRIGFLEIAAVVEETLGRAALPQVLTIDDVIALDREARQVASGVIADGLTRRAV
ncbi:1-deoxy-D-xylulose-5-phosphate reductoisomerase [Radicibacter daui]|uniref:1-deoxy-D-xylulose-5-phosphate reductoisomerase n=1 Tax=Radicibacter daui TaxID=3064829 RepID=UPI004046D9A2